ncbi:three-Cys-motif partner protein TcmP [Thalassolituus oleivorans]|uniref:three-Cys-motif partner protein TcmP n=1 Tax=Thalassolituus oleivorans TaxID=187493 RepID=UPI0030C863A9
MPTKETANTVRPHTEVKLQFYIGYLERYLTVLNRSTVISGIRIYDLYCGAGVYDDGRFGSALRAVNSIIRAGESVPEKTPTKILLNDLDEARRQKVEIEIESRIKTPDWLEIFYSCRPAKSLFPILCEKFEKQKKDIRNLVFIDPYGYKDVCASEIRLLIDNRRTEVVIFLPVEHIYRFKDTAIERLEDPSMVQLRRFLGSFGIDPSNYSDYLSFIRAIESSLNYDYEFYSASFPIENDRKHFYAMFFITASLKGLEKIIEVKWSLDQECGESFRSDQQVDLFNSINKISDLEASVFELISSGGITNLSIYEHVVKKGFMPKHGTQVLKNLVSKGYILTTDVKSGQPARKNTFKINGKLSSPEIYFHVR